MSDGAFESSRIASAARMCCSASFHLSCISNSAPVLSCGDSSRNEHIARQYGYYDVLTLE